MTARAIYGWRRQTPPADSEYDFDQHSPQRPQVWVHAEDPDAMALPDSAFVPLEQVLFAPHGSQNFDRPSLRRAVEYVAGVLRDRHPYPRPPAGLAVDPVTTNEFAVQVWRHPRLRSTSCDIATLVTYAAASPVLLDVRDWADWVRGRKEFRASDLVVTADGLLTSNPRIAKARRSREVNGKERSARDGALARVAAARVQRIKDHNDAADRAAGQLLGAAAVPWGLAFDVTTYSWLGHLFRLYVAIRLHERYAGRRAWRALNFPQCFLREYRCRTADKDLALADVGDYEKRQLGLTAPTDDYPAPTARKPPPVEEVLAFFDAEARRQHKADLKFARGGDAGPATPEGADHAEKKPD